MREHETHERSVVKTITWRVLATVTTVLLVFIFTGQIILAMGLGIVDILSKSILYFAHERTWDHVAWGRTISESE